MKKERVKKIKVLTERLFFNAAPSFRDAAVEAAHSQGIGLSEYLRQCVARDLEKRGSVVIKISKAA